MSEPSTTHTLPQRRSWVMALPLILFAALVALFWFRLGTVDPSRIPSALIGHPAPQTAAVIERAIAKTAHAIMLRLQGCPWPLQQSQEGFLQHILGLAVAQAERPAVKQQTRRFRRIQLLAP